jgi:hypothetical protein
LNLLEEPHALIGHVWFCEGRTAKADSVYSTEPAVFAERTQQAAASLGKRRSLGCKRFLYIENEVFNMHEYLKIFPTVAVLGPYCFLLSNSFLNRSQKSLPKKVR